jgi:PqqD family protein of HPr-rel-A system
MAGPRYTADPPEAVRTVELDGLTALFHRPSGTTHILAPPAPQILDALQQGPANAPTLLKRIREQFEIEGDRGRLTALAARLDELEAAGLVRRL